MHAIPIVHHHPHHNLSQTQSNTSNEILPFRPLHKYDQYIRSYRKEKKRELEKQKIALEEEKRKLDITDVARNLKRDTPVQEILLSKFQEKEARLDELRREKEELELRNLSSSPRISKHSREIKYSEPVYERLQDVRKHSLEKREQLKNALLEREMKEISGTPNINPVSKNIHRNLDTILAWSKERDEKLKYQKEKLEMQEKQQLLSSPRINSISDRLASQMNRSSSIHEHLLAQGQRKQRELEERKKQEIEKQMNDSIPTISAHSANVYREGEVFDRLYNVSLEQENRRREIMEFHTVVPKNFRDPVTGQQLFKPNINQRSASIVRSEPVQDILLRKANEAKRKIEQTKRKEIEEINNQSAENKALPYSQLLVELMELRTNTSTMDRLTKPKEPNHNNSTVMDQSLMCSFQPRICTKSREIDSQTNRNIPREELLLQRGTEYKKNQSRLKQQVLREDMMECTFSPRANSPRSSQNLNQSSFVERSVEWSKKVEKKLAMERQMLEKKEVEGCTFKPRISSPRKTRGGGGGVNEVRSATPPPDQKKAAKKLLNANQHRSMTPTMERRGMDIPSLRPPAIQPRATMRSMAVQGTTKSSAMNDKENHHPNKESSSTLNPTTGKVEEPKLAPPPATVTPAHPTEQQTRKPLALKSRAPKTRAASPRSVTPQQRRGNMQTREVNDSISRNNSRLERESGETDAVKRERDEERRIRAWEEQLSMELNDFHLSVNDINLQELRLSPEVVQLLRQVGIGK